MQSPRHHPGTSQLRVEAGARSPRSPAVLISSSKVVELRYAPLRAHIYKQRDPVSHPDSDSLYRSRPQMGNPQRKSFLLEAHSTDCDPCIRCRRLYVLYVWTFTPHSYMGSIMLQLHCICLTKVTVQGYALSLCMYSVVCDVDAGSTMHRL